VHLNEGDVHVEIKGGNNLVPTTGGYLRHILVHIYHILVHNGCSQKVHAFYQTFTMILFIV
jgi:hypothetical protein